MLAKLSKFFLLLSAFSAAWGTSGTVGASILLMLVPASFTFIFSVCDPSDGSLLSKNSLRENPFFLPGLILMAINLVQVLNPYARVVEYCGYQNVQFLEHVAFIPSGIVRDWDLRDSFFVLLQLAATWYVAVSAWKLFREDSNFARRFIKFFAINGALISILGIVQEFTNAKGIYWLIPTNSGFYSTFYFKTAAGDFMFASMMCCVSWAVSSFNRRNFIEMSFGVFCAALCFFSSCLAASSGVYAILVLSVFAFALFVLWKLVKFLKRGFVSLLLIFALFLLFSFAVFKTFEEPVMGHLKAELDSGKSSFLPRLALAGTSLEIFKDTPVFGAGAGAYGVKAEILSPSNDYRGRYKVFINSAHNDLFEYACEYGIFAIASLLLCFVVWLKSFKRIEWSVHNSIFLWACLMFALHSMFDLLLHIPATMFAFVFMMSLSSTNFRGRRA